MKDPEEPVRWDASESDAPDELRRALTALGDAERPEAAELQRLRERLMTVFEAPPPRRIRLMHALGGSAGVLAIGLALVAGWIGWQRFERNAALPPSASERAAHELAQPGLLGADEAPSAAGVVEAVRVDAAVRGSPGRSDGRGDGSASVGAAPAHEPVASARPREGASADVRGMMAAARKSDRRAVRVGSGAAAHDALVSRPADGASAHASKGEASVSAAAYPVGGHASAVARASDADRARAKQASAPRASVATRAGEAALAPANPAASDAALASVSQAATRASAPAAAAHVNQSVARELAPAEMAGPRLPAADGGNAVLLDEATLLQRARRLSSSDPQQALRVLDEHKRRFPAGMLGPEREVLAIELLRSLSRAQEADRRARAFRRDYPKSVYLPRIEP